MPARTALLILALSTTAAARPADPLLTARRLYNEEHYEQALAAAREAERNPASVSPARLVIGRIHLERYRRTADAANLDAARMAFRSLDPRALTPRERLELQIGLAELLYLDDQFGASAELLQPVLTDASTLGDRAHERALDWWATALDREAQRMTGDGRTSLYARVLARMETELQRNPASAAASYWVAAAARGAGDIDRAMSAASAGWVRAAMTTDRGAALRADLDRLVTQAIIPDRAAALPTRDKQQAINGMIAEWEAFKGEWTK